ncbi:uncharacterized protein FIBRA_00869 [Fibroporia radiculosa]|uniref:DNA polymerase epsilon subunit D n=1 Tax=Fibroporia radiculosa TaxID=599839 RepID=J4HSB9_9APHY|nr:uncharacterized protein FIBRA_00869 [Fibroporia radiculosa]CCL98862.1 predicted protein [Fibroporia radiculosa]
MPRKQPGTSTVTAASQQEVVSEGIENFELPRSLVTKLARSGMSEGTKMQKDVVLSYSKASTVFINYLGAHNSAHRIIVRALSPFTYHTAATAQEVSSSKQHKSISASDVLKALEMVELGDMLPMLQRELQIYREIQKADKSRKSGGSKGKTRESQQDTVSTSVSASSSAPARSNSKGKEKEHKGPTATVLSASPAAQDSEPELEGEEEEGIGEDLEQEIDGDEEMGEDEEDVDEEEDMQDEAIEESEEPIAIEDEELLQDEGGLGDPEDE